MYAQIEGCKVKHIIIEEWNRFYGTVCGYTIEAQDREYYADGRICWHCLTKRELKERWPNGLTELPKE